MIKGEEAAHAIEGVLRLARLDHKAGEGFGRDLSAAARSFFAYVLVLPAIVLWRASEVLELGGDHPGVLAIAEALSVVVETAGFPLLLIFVLRAYKREARWAWFVTGYNWFSAAQTAFLVGIASLCAGPLSMLGPWPYHLAQIYILVLEAFLAEAMLDIGGLRAAGIVLVDVFFSALVDAVGRWIGTGNFNLF